MKNRTILPADTYIVVNKTFLTDTDRNIITMLYQPIIGYTAVSLYFTLLDDLHKHEIMSEDLTHHHLMTTMQLKLADIVIAREKLEACGLLKTYFKKDHINNYVYLIFSPLSPNEFFNHPILNVTLYNNMGKKEYDNLVSYYRIPRLNLKDYEDITASFDKVFTSIPGTIFEENDNIIKYNKGKITLDNNFDFNLLISSFPKNMVNDRCFNDDVRLLIQNLSFIYNIDNFNMQALVRNSLNEKGMIDKMELRKNCRNFYQFENSGKLPTLIYATQPDYLRNPKGDNSNWAKMVYTFETISPYDYLKSKYKGAKPTSRDLKIIENLLIDQQLKPGVINVLLSYVLKINQQKLNKNYIETIAGQWKRLNIETVEDAMRICEKEHKKLKKIIDKPAGKNKTVLTKEEKVPLWFDKENRQEQLSDEDKEELDNLLKSFD